MQRAILSILLLFGALSVAYSNAETIQETADRAAIVTTVFLVRHAEKTADKTDPILTKSGEERAGVLAQTLRSVNLAACFSSEYKRTRLTATPTATAARLKVTERKAGEELQLAAELKKNFLGKNVLFVGHSNTVPSLMRHLGVTKAPRIAESEYDNLFILHVCQNGNVNVTRVHYGVQTSPR